MWVRDLCEVYDKLPEKTPRGHLETNASLELTINKSGEFIRARRLEKDEVKTLIPVTASSSGRTGVSPHPHPLNDQVGYLGGEAKKWEAYKTLLAKFCEFSQNEMANAVLSYILKGEIQNDLTKAEVKFEPKDLVRFRVESFDEPCTWQNETLQNDYTKFFESQSSAETGFCYALGENLTLCQTHPKNIIGFYGNAKLISANDSSGFTFRGRFANDKEALNVSEQASQQIHDALKWLVKNQSYNLKGRIFLCFNGLMDKFEW